MAMMKSTATASPDAYVEALTGWQRVLVEQLRAAILSGAVFDQIIKWHNLMFVHGGLCILIRAEEARVLLGFFRGKRLVSLDPRIKPGGKYELANLTLREGDTIDPDHIAILAREAAALNAALGDPTARH